MTVKSSIVRLGSCIGKKPMFKGRGGPFFKDEMVKRKDQAKGALKRAEMYRHIFQNFRR